MSSPSHFPESLVFSVTTSSHPPPLWTLWLPTLLPFGLQVMSPACSTSLLPLGVTVTTSSGMAVSWSGPDALVPLVDTDLSVPFRIYSSQANITARLQCSRVSIHLQPWSRLTGTQRVILADCHCWNGLYLKLVSLQM